MCSKDRNLQYTFRPQPNGGLFGAYSVQYIASYSQERLKKAPKDLRVAIIYEDGPYGAGVAAANEAEAKKLGMQVVLKEGFSIQAPDLCSLVTKLRAARPDVLFHTGYEPDIALFLRQAKEQGLRVKAYLGHGAGHSQLDKLKEGFGNEIEGFHTVDPIASQLLDPKKLKPGVGELTAEMVKRYKAVRAEHRAGAPSPPTCRWASTTCGSCSTTSCRGRSRSTAASDPRPSPRRRARPTSPRAARCRATA